MIVTLGLTIGFGKSDNLAAAYGIAVSLTMLMTSRAAVHRDARDLGLAVCRRRARCGRLRHRRRRLLRRQPGKIADGG